MSYIKTIDVDGVATQIDYTALANLPNIDAVSAITGLLARVDALEAQISGATETLALV